MYGPALALALSLAGCKDEPATFPARLEAALATRSPHQVEVLLSRASRPLYRAMVASSQRPDGPFQPLPVRQPVRLTNVQHKDGDVVLTVRSGDTQRDWALVDEEGAWRLDLLKTSAWRPYPQ